MIEDGVAQGDHRNADDVDWLAESHSYGWRQEQMAENAQEVSNRARSLRRCARLRNTSTTRHGSIAPSILIIALCVHWKLRAVTARRFERGAITGEEIETLEPIDKAIDH